jgi:4-hydroxybenzoate polyprenyltransferase
MRGRAYRWLAIVPGLGILIGVPLANRVHAYVLGLPFILAWILLCVLLTSVLMALIQEWDRRRDAEDARSRFG